MQYLDYSEYVNIGGILDLAAFNRYIVRACSIVDNETHNRLTKMSNIPDNVKHCLRDLVEYLEANVSGEATVTSRSQSAGGVSESESYSTAENPVSDISNLIYDYLQNIKDDNGIPLLYRGCSC